MLNTIRDNVGSSHRRMRVGRGIGSGKGKTCGRGFKGQKSRCGVSINGFEGGQMPIYRRLPKRGFRSRRAYTAILNLDTLQRAIDKGILSSSINMQKLKEIRLIPNYTKKIRILGNGDIVAPISLVADGVSKNAIQKIESVNGNVDIIDCKNKQRQ